LLPQKLRGRGSLKYRSRLHQMVHNSLSLNVRSTHVFVKLAENTNCKVRKML
jgi:hypothetical protein